MKREILVLTGAGLAILIGVAIVQFQSVPEAPPTEVASTAESIEDIAWHTDLRAAHQESVRLQKPMLLVFGAKWCRYCDQLDVETLARPDLRRHIRDTFVAVRLDFDNATQIAEVLDVSSLPCTIVLSPEADLLGRIDGFATGHDYMAALERACALQLEVGRRMAHTETSVSSQDRTY